MDIYTDQRIPFSVGVWARSHKFNPIAVELTKALKLIAIRKAELATAENELEVAEQALKNTIARAEKELEGSHNGY